MSNALRFASSSSMRSRLQRGRALTPDDDVAIPSATVGHRTDRATDEPSRALGHPVRLDGAFFVPRAFQVESALARTTPSGGASIRTRNVTPPGVIRDRRSRTAMEG